MKRITDSLNPNELIEKLTLETVNLFYLGGDPNDPEVNNLESTIALVAEAWELTQETIDKSIEVIAAEREATRREMQGEQAQGVIPKEKILQGNDGGEIMKVLWGLFEAAIWLGTQEKREKLLQSAQFMAEYLGLEEWVFDTNRPTAKKPA
jgi:hypothetical protein